MSLKTVGIHTQYNMCNTTYDSKYISQIIEHGFEYQLPEKTLELINRISRMVGAPSYIKTPIFHRTNTNNKHNKKEHDMNKARKNRRKQPKPMSDAEWNAVREFEETKMKKIRDGIEKDISLITQQLNKLTNNTYKDCIVDICQVLDRVVDIAEQKDILIICKNIFEISSSNGFYSKIFAKMLSEIIHKYKDMKKVFYDNYKDFMSYFQEFEYVNPDEDYDAFCQCNRENEKRRSYAKCIANLVNEKIINSKEIIYYLELFIEKFEEKINNKDNTYVAEQISEIISAIIHECYDSIKDEDDFKDNILNKIIEISKMKRKNYLSLSSKCIFKMLDLIDIMK